MIGRRRSGRWGKGKEERSYEIGAKEEKVEERKEEVERENGMKKGRLDLVGHSFIQFKCAGTATFKSQD